LMFLGKIPTEKWSDQEVLVADMRLRDFARKLDDLQAIRIYETRRDIIADEDYEVYLLKALRKGGDAFDEVVFVEKSRSFGLSGHKAKILKELANISSNDQKAVLAELMDELFTKSKQLSTTEEVSDEQVV